MNKHSLIKSAFACCCVLMFMPATSYANLVVDGTRIIFPSDKKEVSLKISNSGNLPALMQAWADDGDPDTKPDQADAPFLVTPPIARIDPSKGQALRLNFTGADLPQDRESMFWLNVLDVPPVPAEASANYMQLAYRTRIKIFYRPHTLKGSPEAAAKALTWTVQNGKLKAENSSPYNVSINNIFLNIHGKKSPSLGSGTVAPYQSLVVETRGLTLPAIAPGNVIYNWVSDYGASSEEVSPLAF